jgi:hypothetical protein
MSYGNTSTRPPHRSVADDGFLLHPESRLCAASRGPASEIRFAGEGDFRFCKAVSRSGLGACRSPIRAPSRCLVDESSRWRRPEPPAARVPAAEIDHRRPTASKRRVAALPPRDRLQHSETHHRRVRWPAASSFRAGGSPARGDPQCGGQSRLLPERVPKLRPPSSPPQLAESHSHSRDSARKRSNRALFDWPLARASLRGVSVKRAMATTPIRRSRGRSFGYPRAGICSSCSAGSPCRSSRLRSTSALNSAPKRSASDVSQSQVSMMMTAAREPQVLL